MSDRRVEPGDTGELAGLPPDDPRVRALGARARAQLLAYREFVAPGDVPEGARVADAEARLGEALERELGTPIGLPPEALATSRPTPPAPRRTGGFLTALLAPQLRPALAMVALLIVAGGAWLVVSTQRRPNEPVMRGSAPAVPGTELVAATPEPLADGSLRLSWSPAVDAGSYTVVFLSPDLTEIARVSDLREPRLDLRPGALPAGLETGRQVLWRVLALRGADEVAHSGALAVTLP